MTFVRELIETVRAEPVTGTAIGPDGSPVEVTVDESVVAQIARNTDADMLNLEELPAAGRALSRGDSAPLLRLAGETLGGLPPDFRCARTNCHREPLRSQFSGRRRWIVSRPLQPTGQRPT